MKKFLFPAILVLFFVAILSLVIFHKEKGSYVFGSLLPLSGEVDAYGKRLSSLIHRTRKMLL